MEEGGCENARRFDVGGALQHCAQEVRTRFQLDGLVNSVGGGDGGGRSASGHEARVRELVMLLHSAAVDTLRVCCCRVNG